VETLVGTFAGAIQGLSGGEQWLDEKMTQKVTHRIFCPSATVVYVQDKVKEGTRTFDVKWIDAVELKTGHHLEVLVEEVV